MNRIMCPLIPALLESQSDLGAVGEAVNGLSNLLISGDQSRSKYQIYGGAKEITRVLKSL